MGSRRRRHHHHGRWVVPAVASAAAAFAAAGLLLIVAAARQRRRRSCRPAPEPAVLARRRPAPLFVARAKRAGSRCPAASRKTANPNAAPKREAEEEVEVDEELPWIQDKALDLMEFTGTVTHAIPGPRVGSSPVPLLLAVPLAYVGVSFVLAVVRTVRRFTSPRTKKKRRDEFVSLPAVLLRGPVALLGGTAVQGQPQTSIYKVFDLKNYSFLYSIPDTNVQEIKISPGIMLLIYDRTPSYVPLKILSIEDGKPLKSFKHLLHRNKKIDFIEQFNEKLLVKQEDENLQILNVGWDESAAGERRNRVSIWEIEPVAAPFFICPPPFFGAKRPDN